jgi:hypothetical protein
MKRSERNSAKPGSAVRKARYPSPRAQIVRPNQYEGPESDGLGLVGGVVVGLRVPSGCIQRTTLPALAPVEVCR